MKRKLLTVLLCIVICMPTLAHAEGALVIDTQHIYTGMEKSYSQGYVPSVGNGTATIVLPLSGEVQNNTIRVTPDISTDGPYVYANYQFTVQKGAEQASDSTVQEIFLVRLDLPLKEDRLNGNYPVTFAVDYTDMTGTVQIQSFTVQVTISDGKSPAADSSSGGGGSYVSTSRPIMQVTQVTLDRTDINAGEQFSVSIIAENQGTKTARNVCVSIVADGADIYYADGVTDGVETLIQKGKSKELSFTMNTLPTSKSGYRLMTIQIECDDSAGGHHMETRPFYVIIHETPENAYDKPVLLVKSTETTPETVSGGETFTLKLTLENRGARSARNVRVTLTADGADILPSSDLAGTFVEEVKKETQHVLSVPMNVLTTALSGYRTVTIMLSYEDNTNESYTETTSCRIYVTQPLNLGYDPVKLPEQVVSGEAFQQLYCIYNKGFATAYNVKCTLTVDGLIAASAYLGTLAPGTSAEKEVSVFAATLTTGGKFGETSGQVEITYEDDAGMLYYLYDTVTTNIQEPIVETDAEKEAAKEQQTLSQWWMSLLFGIAVIAILISVIIIAKLSRMMRKR